MAGLTQEIRQHSVSFKVARPRKIKHAAITLTGAPFSLKCRIFRLFFLGSGDRRGQIGVKRLRLGGRATAGADALYLDHPHIVAHSKGQHVANHNQRRTLLRDAAVDPDGPRLHAGSRQRTRLIKPRMPQPFIKPQLCRRFGQLLVVFQPH